MDILHNHCFYKCDAFTLEGWHTDCDGKHTVTLQLIPAKSFKHEHEEDFFATFQLTPESLKYDFNFKCLTRCLCGHCAWRRANAKAKAFLQVMGINSICEVQE